MENSAAIGKALQVSSFEDVYAAYDVFILDLDGTLSNGSQNIEGVAQSVARIC